MNLGWDTSNYTVAQYYSAISSKIGKSKLWADNEFFTCCVFSTRSNTYGYSPSISRLNSQFKITEPYVSRNIAYTVPFYMSPVIEDISSFGQSRLLATYKAFYKIEGDYITPTSYTWTTTPSTTYPDSGNKLFDLESGYADYYKDSSWVGINKYTPLASEYAEVILDLGTEKKIDWIGVETLNWPSKLIEVPSEMQIYSSTNKTNWTLVGTYASANVQGGVDGGTYVIGNYSPLNTSARYFKIKLKNSGWVFVSEIEVVGACVGEAAKDYMEERNYPRQIEWAGLGSACCSSTECVGQNNSCFAGSWTNASSSGMHSGLNLNGNDNSAYCYAEGSWLDCDSWAAYCDDASVCGEADGSVPSGETTPFGEYSTFGEQECCGDDTGEYYITTGNYSACCNNNTDTINSTLNCIGEQNPICTEYPNDQYTLEQINDKISNWRNGNLTLIEILTATKIYKYC